MAILGTTECVLLKLIMVVLNDNAFPIMRNGIQLESSKALGVVHCYSCAFRTSLSPAYSTVGFLIPSFSLFPDVRS